MRAQSLCRLGLRACTPLLTVASSRTPSVPATLCYSLPFFVISVIQLGGSTVGSVGTVVLLFHSHACSNWMLYRSTSGGWVGGLSCLGCAFQHRTTVEPPLVQLQRRVVRARPGRGGVAAHPGHIAQPKLRLNHESDPRSAAKSDQTVPCESFSRSEGTVISHLANVC